MNFKLQYIFAAHIANGRCFDKFQYAKTTQTQAEIYLDIARTFVSCHLLTAETKQHCFCSSSRKNLKSTEDVVITLWKHRV